MIDQKFVRVEPYGMGQGLFRYMEIEKLIFLLSIQAVPLFRMTSFSDQFEGSYPWKFVHLAREQRAAHLTDKFGRLMLPKDYIADKEKYRNDRLERAVKWRRNHFMSCWHASDHESEAMWRLYASYHKGVAIQTDIQTLARELPGVFDNAGFQSRILISSVKYIDFLIRLSRYFILLP